MKTLIFIALVFITSLGFSENQALINGEETFGNWPTETVDKMPQYGDGFDKEIIVTGVTADNVEFINKKSAGSQDYDYSDLIVSNSIIGYSAVKKKLNIGNFMMVYIQTHSYEDSKTITVSVYTTSGLLIMSKRIISSSIKVNPNDLNKNANFLQFIRYGYLKVQNALFN